MEKEPKPSSEGKDAISILKNIIESDGGNVSIDIIKPIVEATLGHYLREMDHPHFANGINITKVIGEKSKITVEFDNGYYFKIYEYNGKILCDLWLEGTDEHGNNVEHGEFNRYAITLL